MELSVGLPPGPRTLEYAQLAQQLGYDRVWLYDSAALYEDIWIWMARLAEHTDLDLGTAVLVPNLRHVMTTASAIATVERMAPGRLSCGFGTGATARWVLNKPALSWATTRRYIEQLRGLLRGEVVEIDGERCQMIHHPDWAAGEADRDAAARVRARAEGQADRRRDVRGRLHRRVHRHGRRRRRSARPGAHDHGHRARRRRGRVERAGGRGAGSLVRRALPRRVAGVPRRARRACPAARSGWRASTPNARRASVISRCTRGTSPTSCRATATSSRSRATRWRRRAGWVLPTRSTSARSTLEKAGGTDLMFTPAGDFDREMRTFAEAVRG